MSNTSAILSDHINTGNANSSTNVSAAPGPENEVVENGCTIGGLHASAAIGSLAIFVGVCIASENLLMIYIIGRHRKLHTNTNILVASLAFSDVMIGLMCCEMGLLSRPGWLISWLRLRPFQLRALFTFMTGANYSLIAVSMAHLAVLSVDRYLYLLWPFRYPRRVTQHRVTMTAVGIWAAGCIYMIMPMVLYLDPQYHVRCIIFKTPIAYGGGPLMCVHSLCLSVVLGSTGGIVRLALQHSRKRELLQHQAVKEESEDCEQAGTVHLGENIEMAVISGGVIPSMILHTSTDNSVGFNENPDTEHACETGAAVQHCSSASMGTNTSQANTQPPTLSKAILHAPGKAETVGFVSVINICDYVVTRNSTLNEEECEGCATNDTDENSAKSVENNCPYHSVTSTGPKPIPLSPRNIGLQTRQCQRVNGVHHKKKERKTKSSSGRSKLKILKFVFLIVGCFLVCSFPSIIFLIIEDIAHIHKLSMTAHYIAGLLLFSNSGINFILMTQLNKDFRSVLLKTLSCGKFPSRNRR